MDKISKKDVREFLENLSEKEKSGSTMNVNHMAIRFLFEEVLNKRIWIDISYSKIPEKIPVVLTKSETEKLFSSIENQKHRLMIEFLYSSGMRVSELVNLTVQDLDIENNYGWIRRGKGGKDRLFIIAKSLKSKISKLIEEEKLKPEDCLFSNSRGGKYSISSPQKILKKASRETFRKGFIQKGKRVSPHILRHSFATHLIENGYSVLEVQCLLGHKSPETTFTYLHAASPNLLKVRSPFDTLFTQSSQLSSVLSLPTQDENLRTFVVGPHEPTQTEKDTNNNVIHPNNLKISRVVDQQLPKFDSINQTKPKTAPD